MFSQSLVKLAIAALAATAAVSAQPHRMVRREQHNRVHRRYAAPAIVTVVHTAPIVYVDQNGATIDPNSPPEPVWVTVTAGAPTPAESAPPQEDVPAPAPEPVVTPEPVPEVVEEAPIVEDNESTEGESTAAEVEQPEEEQPEEEQPEEEKPEEETPSAPAPSSGDKMGIAYSPYHADGSGRVCKSEEEIIADIHTLANFSPIRLYAVDCDQTRVIIEAGKDAGTQVMAAIWNMDDVDNELNQLIEQVGDNWGSVHSVSIGNEVVLSGRKSAGDHVSIINSCRDKLRGAGFEGPVVAADAAPMYLDHPELCEASDFLAINAHPYFDTYVTPEQSGDFLNNMKTAIEEKCGSEKKIIWTGKPPPALDLHHKKSHTNEITETGWPSSGEQKGAAIPSVDGQKAAIKSIVDSIPKDQVILFSAFDDEWKQDTPETGLTEKVCSPQLRDSPHFTDYSFSTGVSLTSSPTKPRAFLWFSVFLSITSAQSTALQA